jgi:hypothetical protein
MAVEKILVFIRLNYYLCIVFQSKKIQINPAFPGVLIHMSTSHKIYPFLFVYFFELNISWSFDKTLSAYNNKSRVKFGNSMHNKVAPRLVLPGIVILTETLWHRYIAAEYSVRHRQRGTMGYVGFCFCLARILQKEGFIALHCEP